jgi:hypothetical protein
MKGHELVSNSEIRDPKFERGWKSEQKLSYAGTQPGAMVNGLNFSKSKRLITPSPPSEAGG